MPLHSFLFGKAFKPFMTRQAPCLCCFSLYDVIYIQYTVGLQYIDHPPSVLCVHPDVPNYGCTSSSWSSLCLWVQTAPDTPHWACSSGPRCTSRYWTHLWYIHVHLALSPFCDKEPVDWVSMSCLFNELLVWKQQFILIFFYLFLLYFTWVVPLRRLPLFHIFTVECSGLWNRQIHSSCLPSSS